MLLMFVNYLLIFVSFYSVSSSSLPEDANYLLQFRDSIPEASRHVLQWSWNQSNSNSSHCQWAGVACYKDRSFQVEALNLTDFHVLGILADTISSLCHLRRLRILVLSGNNFMGNIPAQLGNCSELDTIHLNDNRLSGPIPPEIFQSEKLIDLDLGYNGLSGPIPREVSRSKNLEVLGLYNNDIRGEIPNELFALPNLKVLYLSNNHLTGPLPNFSSSCSFSHLQIDNNAFSDTLPVSLGYCHNLTAFYAYDNNLGGIISPEIFKGISQLQYVYLHDNKFEGEIPETLWGLRNIQGISFSGNKFNGSISESIGTCSMLTYIDLSENCLTGQIPRSLGNLGNLTELYLYRNMLSGPLLPQLGNSSSLVELRLQFNNIRGGIPPEFCELQSLKVFHAYNNQIEGLIPQCVGKMNSLRELALYENKFSGEIPSGISNLTNLSFLSLAYNNLTGELPPDLGRNIPGLETLDLTGNHLGGKIPADICSGNKLSVLVLGYNHFNGNFPTEIIKCQYLTRLILEKNYLQGSIPDDIGRNLKIYHFNARENLFEGRIPASFGSWSNLLRLDLSENMFSGFIPSALGNLGNLTILNLSGNRLTGRIPLELSRCTKMDKLDLSKNNLSGSIPPEIISSKTLKNLLLDDNQLSGVIPDSFSASQMLDEVQLGSNMLEGHIPCSLSKLQSFSSALNLSMNRLSGEIPACLGDLDKLQILDLSSNNFSGEIPPRLENMRSLTSINISFNHLSGRVPYSWEKNFASNPGSALENRELCLPSNHASYCGYQRKSNARRAKLAGIIVGLVLSTALVASMLYIPLTRTRKRTRDHESLYNDFQSSNEDLPEDLSFKDIVRSTEGWNEKYVIGKGKHGTVYKVESERSKKVWAVKKVDLSEEKSSNDMRILGQIRHRNVVKMAGYSVRHGCSFIVTEFMPGGTLYKVLHQSKNTVALNWETRFRIALGIAQGLSYLHHDCVPQIIHRDVKSDNILMDSELEPKIGDFGMAKLVSDSEESSPESRIVGTLGYIAPENACSIRLTEKCDVYSYGVILMEVLCRKLPVDPSFEDGLDIVAWAREKRRKSNDPLCCLHEETRLWNAKEKLKAVELMDLALLCTERSPDTRPSMREVVSFLVGLNQKDYCGANERDKQTISLE